MKYILSLLITLTPAIVFAQDTAAVGTSAPAGAPPQPSILESFAPLILMFFLLYFLLIRPQQKKFKAHMVMTSGLKKGDKVITGAGFVGTVVKENEGEKFIEVSIAEGVNVKVLRSSITELAEPKTPAAEAKK